MGYTNCDICNVLFLSNEFQSTLTGKSYCINFRFDYNINRPINCTVRERKDLKNKNNRTFSLPKSQWYSQRYFRSDN